MSISLKRKKIFHKEKCHSSVFQKVFEISRKNFICTLKIIRVLTWLIIAVMYTTKAAVKLKTELNSSLSSIRTHNLCDAGAVLYQLSQQANWELVTLLVRNIRVEGSISTMWYSYIQFHYESALDTFQAWRFHTLTFNLCLCCLSLLYLSLTRLTRENTCMCVRVNMRSTNAIIVYWIREQDSRSLSCAWIWNENLEMIRPEKRSPRT